MTIETGKLPDNPLRTSEAEEFLNAFADNEARLFLQDFIAYNYYRAIMKYHPDSSELAEEDIREKCTRLIGTVFGHIQELTGNQKAGRLFSLFEKLTRSAKPSHPIWFDEFNEAYENYKHHEKLKNRYNQLRNYLQGDSLVDIGCGGGDLVYYIKQRNPAIRVAGIDVLDWRTPDIKDKIDFHMLDFKKDSAQSPVKYDMGICLAVLHHVGKSDEQISTFLKGISTAIRKKGRLLIEEDVIITADEIESNPSWKNQIDANRKNHPFYEKFLNYDKETQTCIIKMIDFLANALTVGVPEMAFPFGFRSITEWIKLFEKNGYELVEINNLGFVKDNFNICSHVLFILNKK